MINYSVNGELTLNTAQFDKEIMKSAQKLEEFNNLIHKLGKDPLINENAMNNFKTFMGYTKELTYKMLDAEKEANKLKAQLDNLFTGGRGITEISKKLTATKQLVKEESLIAKEKKHQEWINKELIDQNNELISQEEKINALKKLSSLGVFKKSTVSQSTLDLFNDATIGKIRLVNDYTSKYAQIWLEKGKATSAVIRQNINDIDKLYAANTRLQIATAKAKATALYNSTIIPNPSISQNSYNQLMYSAKYDKIANSIKLMNKEVVSAILYVELLKGNFVKLNTPLLETTRAVALLGTGISGLLTSGVSGLLGMAQNFSFRMLENNTRLLETSSRLSGLEHILERMNPTFKTLGNNVLLDSNSFYKLGSSIIQLSTDYNNLSHSVKRYMQVRREEGLGYTISQIQKETTARLEAAEAINVQTAATEKLRLSNASSIVNGGAEGAFRKFIATAEEMSSKSKQAFNTASESARSFGNSTKESLDKVKLSVKEAMESTVAYINTMRLVQSATRGSVGALSQLGMAAQTAQKRTEGLSYSLRRLKSLMTLAATIMVWDFAFGLIETTSETFKAKSEMESYYNVLGWTTAQQLQFNASLDKTVSQFARINKFQLGETLTSLGVEFDLSAEELQKASNVVPMVMNEYLRAGRTTDEAVLAVKDIMQGEFMRLSRETGVGKEELQALGWSGDTTDIDSLMTALERAGSARHWDVFASKATSLNDVLLISQNRFSEFATMVMSVFTPLILAGFNSVIGAFDGLISAFQNMNGIDDVIVTGGTAFVTFRLLIGALGVLKSKTKEWIIVREANLLGINAEQAKLQGLNTTYAASLMAQEKETLTKEKEIFDRYANIVATEQETLAKEAVIMATTNEAEMRNLCSLGIEEYTGMVGESSFAQTQETFATLENASAKEKLALALETEMLIQESSIDIEVARTLGIEAQTIETFKLASAEEIRRKMLLKAQLAEVSGWKITTARILNLEMEALATGGLTGALYAKILGLEGVAAAETAEAFAAKAATTQTKLFTLALLANPYFDAFIIGVTAVVGALYALGEVTRSDRDAMSAYNKELENASDTSDKLAQKVKSFDDSYNSYIEGLSTITEERIYQAELEMGLVTQTEQKYHDLYGAASQGILKLKESMGELYAMTQTQVYITTDWEKQFKEAGYSDEDAKSAGRGMGGWMGWKKQSYEDYLKTDDFMIQLETLLAMKLADLGMALSSTFWGAVFSIENINKSIDSFNKSLNSFFNLDNINSWLGDVSGDVNKWFVDNFIKPIQDFDLEQQIRTYIIDPFLYWINPANWFSGAMVSAADGSGGSGGLTAEDWAGFFGLVDSTKQAISLKLQDLVNTIKYWLNPLNWFTNDGGAGIISWWNTNIADPLNGVLSIFGIDLHVKGEEAGTNLKNGVQSGSSGTPQAVKGNLDPITGMLDTFKSTVGWLGRKLGLNLKTNVKTGSNGTHIPVADEMNDILSSIKNKQGEIWSTAYNTARGIVDWIAKGLERKSPGASARMTLQEMKDIEMFMVQQQPNLYASAKATGQTIVQGMHDANLSNMQSGQSVAFGLNKATLSNTTATYNKLDGVVTNAFNGLDSTIDSTGLSVANNLTTMSNSAKTTFTDMSTDVSSLSLTNDQYLSAMSDSTLSTTIQMTNAWSTMKDRIVTVASQIRSQSYDKFNSLHKTIASFYNQLASAHFTAGLAAGSPFSRGTNNYRTRSPRRYSSGAAGGSGLANIPMKHTKKIMNTAYPWKIADPWFLGIQIPMDNRVEDFKDGNSKRITYDSFEGILAKVLTARGFRDPSTYEFYWNSKKTNQQVWDSVGCNCYDGAEMIIEIAQMLGLDGSLVHGSWNGLGHMGAMIGGKLYDMTQFQKHGVFRGTKGVVFGTNSGTSRYTSGAGRVSNSQQTVVKETTYNVSVDLSNSRIYGIDDLDDKIDNSVRKSIIKLHGKNPATGV